VQDAKYGNRKARTIAYIGPFKFPDASAPSRRIEGMLRSLRAAGHKLYVGAGHSTDDRTSALAVEEYKTLCALRYCDEVPTQGAPKLYKLYRHLTCGGDTLRWLQQLDPRPDAVILFGGFVPYLARLLPWAAHNGVAVIVDAVEWYDTTHLPGGRFGPLAANSEIAMRWLYPRAGNIIAISRFLETYYERKGCRTVRVPPTLDVKGTLARLEVSTGRLELAYAGVPGKKDLIENIVEAVLRVDPAGKQLRLTLVGPTAEAVLGLQAVRSRDSRRMPPCLEAVGRVSHDRALDIVRGSDFMPLLRPPHRYAQAGFPTKVAESLSLGTPVLCNVTSDLGEYLRDGREGLIAADHTPEAFAHVLERALVLGRDERLAMRRAAREAAEQTFDYRRYSAPLDQFVREACA
jgi:glycosyltransferase involved in cell wall biosynthesis